MTFDRLRDVTGPEGTRMAMPRASLVFVHPDDEVIAVGGWMGRLAQSPFVHVPDGAPYTFPDFSELAGEAERVLQLEQRRDARPGTDEVSTWV